MRIFFAHGHAIHDCAGEIKDGKFAPCFENPRRLAAICAGLARARLGPLEKSGDFGLGPILDVHEAGYLAFLREAHQEWRASGRDGDIFPLAWPGPGMRRDRIPVAIDGKIGLYAFDSGTPIGAQTWQAACDGAQLALSAAKTLLGGERLAFACARPPGHHAMPGQYGGYCFINNAAVAANWLCRQSGRKVAVLDVDYHHGNGTQAIFYAREDVLVVNLHADPRDEYPFFLGHADETGEGPGYGYTLNLPLAPGCDWATYSRHLEAACEAIAAFGPDFLVVSFGADTFVDDPLGRFRLTLEDYPAMGAAIARLGLPALVVMEGGYAIEALGDIVPGFLNGLNSG